MTATLFTRPTVLVSPSNYCEEYVISEGVPEVCILVPDLVPFGGISCAGRRGGHFVHSVFCQQLTVGTGGFVIEHKISYSSS